MFLGGVSAWRGVSGVDVEEQMGKRRLFSRSGSFCLVTAFDLGGMAAFVKG